MIMTQASLEDKQDRIDMFAAFALSGGHPVNDCYRIALDMNNQRYDFMNDNLPWQIEIMEKAKRMAEIDAAMVIFQDGCTCYRCVVFDVDTGDPNHCPKCARHRHKLENDYG